VCAKGQLRMNLSISLPRYDLRSRLLNRLSALGLDDRAVWGASPETTGATDTVGARDLGFSLPWAET
jgi:hypothetical protein